RQRVASLVRVGRSGETDRAVGDVNVGWVYEADLAGCRAGLRERERDRSRVGHDAVVGDVLAEFHLVVRQRAAQTRRSPVKTQRGCRIPVGQLQLLQRPEEVAERGTTEPLLRHRSLDPAVALARGLADDRLDYLRRQV